MPDDTGDTPPLLGALSATDGLGVVRIEDRYDTGIEDLWTAITDPERLARWYGEATGELRPGGRFRLYVPVSELESDGQVEVCEPPRHLRVSLRETDESVGRGDGPPPHETVVEATLTEAGAGADAADRTDLTIEVRGLPLANVAYYGAGWQINAENLAAYTAGRPPADRGSRWSDLVPPYQQLAAPLG